MIATSFYKKIIGLLILLLITFMACSDKSTEVDDSANDQNKQQISTNQGSDSKSSVSNSASKTEKPIDSIPVKPFIPVIETSGANWNPLSVVENTRVHSPPDASQIKLEYDQVEENVRIIANRGAVSSGASVMIANLELGVVELLRADSSGAFEANVSATNGTHILIKQDVTGDQINLDNGPEQLLNEGSDSPGIILSVPVGETENAYSFGGGGRGPGDGYVWIVEGNISKIEFESNDNATIGGEISILTDSSILPNEIGYNIMGQMIADENGLQVGPGNLFFSNIFTGTGLPIVPGSQNSNFFNDNCGQKQLDWKQVKEKSVSSFECEMNIDTPWLKTGSPIGTYIIWFNVHFPEKMNDIENDEKLLVFGRMGPQNMVAVAIVTVGSPKPMKLMTTLLADHLQEGARGGILSREDVTKTGISSLTITHHNPVIPRVDPYGDSYRYRLDPYAPLLGVTDRAPAAVPFIEFDFANSQIEIDVKRPDGDTDIIGPIALSAYGVKTPILPGNNSISGGGGHIGEIPQLLGFENGLAYKFPLDGDYVLKLSGYVSDRNGYKFEINGTYDLTVANSLDIETELLPGTPFEIGNHLPIGLHIYPKVPANINFTVTHVDDANVVSLHEYEGVANGFGYWDGDGKFFSFQQSGEYKIHVEAQHFDKDGRLWVGRMVYGGVIATEDAPIIVHGIRGPDDFESIPPPWGFGSDFESGGHHQFPFFTGDILWGIEDAEPNREAEDMGPGDSVITGLSFQALNEHPLVIRAINQANQVVGGSVDIDELKEAGEIPLTTITELDQDNIGVTAYSYNSAQRPGVRVRETIQRGDVGKSYWRFNDAYHMQSGNSPHEGDRPGEFKFLYGGAVIRDEKLKEGVFGIYGSGWVLLNRNDPQGSRFMPPFQGNAGGPNGGPLFNIHGRDIDMFFVPLGVRPGAILETGDIFKMAGPVMPTLNSRVHYTVISPDGTSRVFEDIANSVGYYYNPSHDFPVDKPGLWTVELSVMHDGMTSAGPVQEPYPTGGPLTPDGRTFTFVVIDEKTHILNIGSDLVKTKSSNWYGGIRQARFGSVVPEKLDSSTVQIIVSIPGIVLLNKELVVENGMVDWLLNGRELNQLVGAFDPDLSDTITVTYYVGDKKGNHAAGSITTHGARVPIGTDLPPNQRESRLPTGQTSCLATEKVLFADDFESGSQKWEFSDESAWTIIDDGGSGVLRGFGHVHAFAGDKWEEVVWRMRLKLTKESATHLNFHASDGKRYLISFSKHGTHIIVDDSMFASSSINHSLGDWHIVEISRIDSVLRVAVDDVLEIEGTDPNPLPPGRIWFEVLDESEVLFDDVNVCAVSSKN